MSSSLSLRVHDLSFSYPDRVVFDGLNLTFGAGSRVGLVGENGVGKSTLLRLLARRERPRAGRVEGGGDIGFLHQELPFPDTARLSDVVDDALAEIRRVLAELDVLGQRLHDRPDDSEALDAYGRALEWALAHQAWDADRRAELVCDGLGLSDIDRDRPISTLSGGQRCRLALAALLIRSPETLLLDEPTNHLDDDALDFVQEHLSATSGIVVLSSHDRVFLDAVCTDIVDLDPAPGGPTRYGGAYSEYLAHKRAERARWEQRYAEERKRLDQLRHAVRVTARRVASGGAPRDNAKMAYDYSGGRVQKQISRRVRAARQQLSELERNRVRKPPAPLRFAAVLTDEVGDEPRRALAVRDAAVAGRLRPVPALDVHIGGESATRLLVTGGNGAGKSTLLSLLAGRLTPSRGTVERAQGVRVGLLEQDVRFADPKRTPQQLYDAAIRGRSAPSLTSLGLVAPRELNRPVGTLSVGQRRRVALALLIARPPHVLLLDEPTNHISLTLTEELCEALDTTPGAVVLASHDRWLRRRWDGAELALPSA
ncbi:ABC-F family ATP-binding cassette domain-containing protein [Saccharomonospora glauca]|uniref:ATPase component of ABC transporters with duplicated ATPase domain n=1 Tax=Saccharomonospora glauca K62 TaxID=928724 RepID=I1D354_9PSEU|nr:ABC-F family ATP-binding cassette domain-containing protein [Saccharomonospora glauca]EIE99378.1 ATPase component of ABC transporters with duplicated ATPase domain [Saccharomonospora glauca K62]